MTTTAERLVGVQLSGARVRVRDGALDRLRGLAIVLMVADHVAAYADWTSVRMTFGRAAMPLFFVLAGHLSRRLSWRLLWIGLVGLWLPVVVPWIDRPNVLLILAAGAVVLAAARRAGVSALVLCAFVLMMGANRFGSGWPVTGYDALYLLGLMALGAALPRGSFAAAGRLPRWLERPGRRPLTVYVVHLLVLTALLGAP